MTARWLIKSGDLRGPKRTELSKSFRRSFSLHVGGKFVTVIVLLAGPGDGQAAGLERRAKF